MADSQNNIVVNPKAGALFRLLVSSKGGLQSELIEGGILVNPLHITATTSILMSVLVQAKSAFDAITLPPVELDTAGNPVLDSYGKAIPTSDYIKNGQVISELQSIYGKQELFDALKKMIGAIGDCNSTLIIETRCLANHTNRVINNLIELSGLAESYTQNIQQMGVGTSINQLFNTTDVKQVSNASGQSNNTNDIMTVLNTDASMYGFVSSQNKSSTPLSTPSLGLTTSYGSQYGADINPQETNLRKLKTYGQIKSLSNLLDTYGIKNVSLPTDPTLAIINSAAHTEQLFYSIIPEKFGGLGQLYLNQINQLCSQIPDLSDHAKIYGFVLKLNNITSSIRNLITAERQAFSEQMLQPPTFPMGTTMETIYQMTRCNAIINMSQNTNLQGILSSCISQLALTILQSS